MKKSKKDLKLHTNYACMLNPDGLTRESSISQDHYSKPEITYVDWVTVHISDSIIFLSNNNDLRV